NVYISNNYAGGMFGPGGTQVGSSLSAVTDSHTISLQQTAGNISIAGKGVILDQGNGTGQTGTLQLDAAAGSIVYRGDLPNALGGNVGNIASPTLLTSAGSITGAGVVSGTTVTLDSATGIGTGTAGRINTAAGTLAARATTSGGVFISEADAVTLATVNGVSNSVTGTNAYDLVAGGPITIAGGLDAGTLS